ncbi:hypothetical protein [Cyanobacterium sp. Dongsha4]|nr:hypothetical protein [Cyanobacterium sp. Dongsha4]
MRSLRCDRTFLGTIIKMRSTMNNNSATPLKLLDRDETFNV